MRCILRLLPGNGFLLRQRAVTGEVDFSLPECRFIMRQLPLSLVERSLIGAGIDEE